MSDKLVSKAIPYAEVKTLVKEYHAYSSKNPEHNDKTAVKCVWFGIEQVKAMLSRMEAAGADGLRVYLGRYPADVSGFAQPQPVAGTNTVIFVPTKVNDKGVAKSDYFEDAEGDSAENRGEQCQPNCGGTDDGLTD